MKQRLLFAFLIISSSSFAQSRHQLKNHIQAYKDSVVLTATYPISSDILLERITKYYVSEGWVLEEDEQRFAKVVTTRSRRDEPRTIQRSGISRTSRYVTCGSKTLVEIEVQETDGLSDFSARVYLDQNHDNRGWDCPNRPTYYRPQLDELSLRRYLYIQVYGDELEFSADLQQSIAKFNQDQSIEKRLLVAGVDY